VTVYVTDEQDQPVDTDELVALARHVLKREGVTGGMELSVVLVDPATIADLNQQHLGKDGPTDVLAFPMDAPGESPTEVPGMLGDVVLCPSVAAEQAPGLGRSVGDEIRLLTVHGILHLLGMDHADPEDERTMFARTDELLASFTGVHGGRS
jgi:probable rRNA maturation factor